MVQKSTFELIREKYKQAQTEKFKEVEKERKALIGPEDVESEPEPEPPRKKRLQTVQEAKKKHST